MIVSVIPARKGSITIPRKNFQSFAGKPLFEWTLKASTRALMVDFTIVSSDDQGALDSAEELGAKTILRQESLSGSDIHASNVVLDAIKQFRLADDSIVLMLLPTAPLRTTNHIDSSMKVLSDSTASPSIIGVYESGLPHNYRRITDGWLVPIIEGDMNVQRQDVESLYKVNGAIFGARVGEFKRSGTFHMRGAIPYIMTADDSIDINSWEDFHRAEQLFLEKQI